MGDDRGQRREQGATPSRGSIVLTPPGGIPIAFDPAALDPTAAAALEPGDVRAFLGASTVADVSAPASVTASCLCGHEPDVHEHWRRGSDCGTCGTGACTTYRPRGGVARRLLRGLGLIR